jgi:hypothetical protein
MLFIQKYLRKILNFFCYDDILEFDYTRVTPDLIEEQPVADVVIFIKDLPFSTIGIIDSGADYVTIPMSAVEGLGLNPKELGKAQTTGGVCGNSESIVCDGDIQIGQYRIPIKICLVRENTIALIGRQGVFDYFHIEFDKDEKKIYFKR